MALTRRQREVLDVIRVFIARNGYSPSLEEIGGALGLSSVATVHKHVTHLVDKGFARRAWNQNRSIDLVPPPEGNGSIDLPLRAGIEADPPPAGGEVPETLSVPASMVAGRGEMFALRAQGSAMVGGQIRDGDILLVEERQLARDGETVLALIDDDLATLGTYSRDGAVVRLQPSGDERPPVALDADRVRVRGVVVGLIRRY